jgi:hypothetical protein
MRKRLDLDNNRYEKSKCYVKQNKMERRTLRVEALVWDLLLQATAT